MSYEYGSQQVEIPNPFRFEGTVYTARAAVLCCSACMRCSRSEGSSQRTSGLLGTFVALGGTVLLGFGVFAAYRGPI